MAFSSLAELVANFENPTGNPSLHNQQGGTASGLYQFVPSTWRRYLSQLGGDTSLYPTAASAPADVQNQVFAQAVSQRGLGDWTCPNCDPALNSYLASNPSAASLPVFSGSAQGVSGGAGASGVGDSPLGGDGGASVGAGGPQSVTQTGSLADKAGGWFNALGTWFAKIAPRAVLFVVAVLLLLGAFYLFGTNRAPST